MEIDDAAFFARSLRPLHTTTATIPAGNYYRKLRFIRKEKKFTVSSWPPIHGLYLAFGFRVVVWHPFRNAKRRGDDRNKHGSRLNNNIRKRSSRSKSKRFVRDPTVRIQTELSVRTLKTLDSFDWIKK